MFLWDFTHFRDNLKKEDEALMIRLRENDFWTRVSLKFFHFWEQILFLISCKYFELQTKALRYKLSFAKALSKRLWKLAIITN